MKTWHIVSIVVSAALAAAYLLYLCTPAGAHDWKKPNLDDWYSSLMRPHTQYGGGTSCCSKEDCHTTDAEQRRDEDGTYHWWAKYCDLKRNPDGHYECNLGGWVKVPDELIVKGPNGNPVTNEAGEAVFCHTQANIGGRPAPAAASYFCFVPPNQI